MDASTGSRHPSHAPCAYRQTQRCTNHCLIEVRASHKPGYAKDTIGYQYEPTCMAMLCHDNNNDINNTASNY